MLKVVGDFISQGSLFRSGMLPSLPVPSSEVLDFMDFCWLVGIDSRGGVEDTRLEAKTKAKDTKKFEAKAKDSLSEDRHSRGQGQKCSRPRPRTKDTSASALQKKKKKVFQKIFQALHKILTIQKIVLSSSRGQANFRGLKASRPRPKTWPSRPRTSKSVLEDVLEAKNVLEDSTSDWQLWSTTLLILFVKRKHSAVLTQPKSRPYSYSRLSALAAFWPGCRTEPEPEP